MGLLELVSMSKYRPEVGEDFQSALQGIHFADDMLFMYTACGNKKNKERKIPGYVLPLVDFDDVVQGLFSIDGQVSQAPVGFMYRWNWLRTDYLQITPNGNILKIKKSSEKIFLPLVAVPEVFEHLGIHEGGEFIPNENSPFQILGLDINKKIYPLVLTDMNLNNEARGLYFNRGNVSSVKLYSLFADFKKYSPQLRVFLDNFYPGEGTIEKVVEEEGALVKKSGALVKKINFEEEEEINWEEPKSIVAYLNRHVIGQEEAKKSVAVAFSSYMIKVRSTDEELPKDNMLLIGSSGVGKTLMISLLAKKADLLFVQSKLTGKSSTGYVGENLSQVFDYVRDNTKGETPYGVVFFDELDKLAWSGEGASGFGLRKQEELIGWLEEAVLLGSSKKEKERLPLSTKNILFITAGAFQGEGDNALNEIIRKRLNKGKSPMGFGAENLVDTEENLLHKVRASDIIEYGLKPELVGRLPYLAVLDPLTVDEKVKILKDSQMSPLKKYAKLLEVRGYSVSIRENVLERIAELCPEETGARALSAICNNLFTDILYSPEDFANADKKIRIDLSLSERLITLYN